MGDGGERQVDVGSAEQVDEIKVKLNEESILSVSIYSSYFLSFLNVYFTILVRSKLAARAGLISACCYRLRNLSICLLIKKEAAFRKIRIVDKSRQLELDETAR